VIQALSAVRNRDRRLVKRNSRPSSSQAISIDSVPSPQTTSARFFDRHDLIVQHALGAVIGKAQRPHTAKNLRSAQPPVDEKIIAIAPETVGRGISFLDGACERPRRRTFQDFDGEIRHRGCL
jgi:hypothetical protein